MNVTSCQPNTTSEIINTVKEQYALSHQREGIHVTDLTLCLRVAYFNKTDPLPPSDKSVVYFIRGLGLQDVLLKHLPTEVREVDGITMSPDYYKDETIAELKTTMMGKKRLDSHDFPKHWIKQIQAYCFGFEEESALLIVLPLLGATLPLTYRLEFTPAELIENWDNLCTRKTTLDICLRDNKLPLPPAKETQWVCTDCQYALRCATI